MAGIRIKTGLNPLRTLRQKFRSNPFFLSESGVAAMEFAIIAPMIIGLYLGLAELASALSADRRISHSASVAGDLATQVTSLSESDAEDLVSAVLHVADMRGNDNYILRLQSYFRRPNGSVGSEGVIIYRNGSHGGLTAYDKNSFSTELLPIGGGIVVASVKHRYEPFGFKKLEGDEAGEGFLPTDIELDETFLLKPRRSATVSIGEVGTHVKITCSGSVDNVTCVTQT